MEPETVLILLFHQLVLKVNPKKLEGFKQLYIFIEALCPKISLEAYHCPLFLLVLAKCVSLSYA